MTTEPIHFSHSAASGCMRCPRAYKYGYVDRIRSLARPVAPALGVVIHAGLLKGILAGDGHRDSAMGEATSEPDWEALDDCQRMMVEGVLLGCGRIFANLRGAAEVNLCEEKLRREENGVVWTIVPDAVLTEDKKYLFELKTTSSSISSWTWEKAKIAFQPHYYANELRHHGHDCAGYDWQILKLPTQKKYSYERSNFGPTEYVHDIAKMMASDTATWAPHRFYYYEQARLEEALRAQFGTADIMASVQSYDVYPQRTSECFAFGRRCDYFPVCHEGETIENTDLYRYQPRKGEQK